MGEEETGTLPYLAGESAVPERTVMSSIPPAERGLVSTVSLTGRPHWPVRRERRLAGGWGISQGHQEPENRASFLSLLSSQVCLGWRRDRGHSPGSRLSLCFPALLLSKLDLRFYNAQKEKPLGPINYRVSTLNLRSRKN